MPELNFNLLAPTAELYSGPQVKMDPVAAYEKAKAARQSNMLAQLYAKHYDPQTGGVNYNALIGEAAQTGLSEAIPSIMGEAQKQAKSQADIAQTQALQRQQEAAAGKYQQEQKQAEMLQHAKESYMRLQGVNTPDQFWAWHLSNPELPGVDKESLSADILQQISTPEGFQKALNASKQALESITGYKPPESKYYERDLGATTDVLTIDPKTGKATVVPGSVATKTLSASEKLARDRFEAEKEKGNFSPETIDFLADMFNQGAGLPTLGLGASGVKMQIIEKARQKSKEQGVTSTDAASDVILNKQKLAAQQSTLKAFSSGVEARRVTANNTAINHLQTMDRLADDLANSDIRIVNKAANLFAKETGKTAPTNFDAAKQLVAAEVIKAVVASGGGVTERQEAEQQFANANSPKQLKEVINTYRELLGGQLQSLQLQYEYGTGRKDFTQRLSPNTRALLTSTSGGTQTPPAGGAGDLTKEEQAELEKLRKQTK